MSSGHLKNPHHASCSESGPNRPAARNLRVDKSREIDLLLDQNERQGLCLATKDRCLRKALLTRACAGMLVSPAPASSLGHLTGTASRPAPNPSISCAACTGCILLGYSATSRRPSPGVFRSPIACRVSSMWPRRRIRTLEAARPSSATASLPALPRPW